MKAWLICNTNGCNGKTKVDYCRKCKKIYSSEIPKTPLPPVGKDEECLLSDTFCGNIFIERIYPNSYYRIKNYNINDYYKKHIIHISLIMPKYINGKKIKQIKKR